MNKKESLAFLQSCLDSINTASSEEIVGLQEAYDLNCMEPIASSVFAFVPPVDTVGCLYETKEVMHLKFSDSECVVETFENQWNYNLRGARANNEQSDENLPYAA